MFRESLSFIFKHVRVVRISDPKRNAPTYLTVLDKRIDGSPDNAIAAVAVLDQMIPLKEPGDPEDISLPLVRNCFDAKAGSPGRPSASVITSAFRCCVSPN